MPSFRLVSPLGPSKLHERQAEEIAKKINLALAPWGTFGGNQHESALPCDTELRNWHKTYAPTSRMIRLGLRFEQGESKMKSNQKSITSFVVILAGLAFLTSLGVAGETKGGMSAKDEDAFILYEYSLLDAKKSRASKITESTEGNKTTYNYDGHALSCRTVMTGSITKTVLEKKTHVVGDFEVSNNSYGITQLSFDFHDEGRETRTGTMTVDDKVIDIKHFDHR